MIYLIINHFFFSAISTKNKERLVKSDKNGVEILSILPG